MVLGPRERGAGGVGRLQQGDGIVPKQRSPVPPAPEQAFRSNAVRSADMRRSTNVLSLGYMPPVNQMVADRRGAAAAAVVSDQSPALRQVRSGAARPGGRSRHHLSPRISLHQRHHQAPARQLRRAVRGSVGDAEARAGTIWSSTSARTTARCFRTSRRRPPRARHRADRGRQDRRQPRNSRRCSAISPRSGGRGAARARPGARRHGGQLLRPYRGRARDRRGHPRTARPRTACSFPSRTT